MAKRKKETEDASATKSGLVQFRANEELMTQLNSFAEARHVPIGILARMWVAERLKKELSHDWRRWLGEWTENRAPARLENLQELETGPVLIITIVPFLQDVVVDPENCRRFQGLLSPVERAERIVGRINADGYLTSVSSRNGKILGYVQIFRDGGQLEAARVLPHDSSDKVIFIDAVANDLIRSIWSYCCALEALKIPLPIGVHVAISGVKGYRYESASTSENLPVINQNDIYFPELRINAWSPVLKFEDTLNSLKSLLDRLSNAGGMSRIPRNTGVENFSLSGDRAYSRLQLSQTAKQLKPTTLITLAGVPKTNDRVDLTLEVGGQKFLVGKVRLPLLEASGSVNYEIKLLTAEMQAGAISRLELARDRKEICNFSVHTLYFSGSIQNLHHGVIVSPSKEKKLSTEPTVSFTVNALIG